MENSTVSHEQVLEALKFFRENDCEVQIWEFAFGNGSEYEIWSNISKRWIATELNDFRLVEFYNKHK